MFFVLISLIFQTQEIKMESHPTQLGKINIESHLTIQPDNLFYDQVFSTIDDQGQIYIFDHGNKVIHVYDQTGKHIRAFGKEGNGPGELNGYFESIAAANDKLILNIRRTVIFDHQGNFLAEIPRVLFDAFEATKNGLNYYRGIEYPSKYLIETYDFNGKLVEKVDNPNYRNNNSSADAYSNANLMNTLVQRFSKPKDFQPYKTGYIQRYAGQFKIEILDKNRSKQITLTRDFPSVQEIIDRNVAMGNTKGQIVTEARRIVTGGIKDDIQQIIGSINGYIFLSVATDKDETLIDVINPNYEYIDQFKFDGNEITAISIVDHYLILSRKNDETGPYVEIYRIKV